MAAGEQLTLTLSMVVEVPSIGNSHTSSQNSRCLNHGLANRPVQSGIRQEACPQSVHDNHDTSSVSPQRPLPTHTKKVSLPAPCKTSPSSAPHHIKETF